MPQELNKGVVQIWNIDLSSSPERRARAYQLLSEDERQRAARYRFARDERRFVLARASLRKVLGICLETDPRKLEFTYSRYGKPGLQNHATDVHFNCSRSHERALIALTRSNQIGVDIEWTGRDLDVDELALRFFTAQENERLRAVPPNLKVLTFLRCWTCKEAYLKAVGQGLSLDLNSFDVSIALADAGTVLSTQNEKFAISGWSLVALGASIDEEYVSALVTRDALVYPVVQHRTELEF